MLQKSYYFDTCIWLNLFKKEGDSTKGMPYWELAKRLIEQIENSKDNIIVSTIVLKELNFKLGNKFFTVKDFFKNSGYINIIKTTSEDYDLAL